MKRGSACLDGFCRRETPPPTPCLGGAWSISHQHLYTHLFTFIPTFPSKLLIILLLMWFCLQRERENGLILLQPYHTCLTAIFLFEMNKLTTWWLSIWFIGISEMWSDNKSVVCLIRLRNPSVGPVGLLWHL